MFALVQTRCALRYKRALDLAFAASALPIVVGWLIVATVHLNDRYQVLHGQGAWMALAQHANVMGLYPALFDGTSYGGTRHMPVTILLHAAAARYTGEYLMSGKLVGLLGTIMLMIAVVGMLRALRCRWSWAIGLAASVVGGYAGLRAGTTIGGEPLPVLFGVCAMTVILYSRSHAALMLAAALVALGVSSKLTALWAPAAIAASLLIVEPKRAAAFSAYALLATAALLGVFNLISNGRLLANLIVTAGAGSQGAIGFVKAPARLLGFMVTGEPALWALVPVLACAAGIRRWGAEFALLAFAWLAASALLVIIFTDIGTGPNQLLDLAVLTVLCVGLFVGSANLAEASHELMILLLVAILIWSNISAFIVTVRPPMQAAVGAVVSGRNSYPRNALNTYVAAEQSVLSEDASILVELGRLPVVVDAFMLRRVAQTRPSVIASLVSRVERREFGLIVLVVRLDNPHDVWWRDYEFGTEVMSAVDRAYIFDRQIGPHYLYRPRS